ncbi:MAG: sulfurtransferase TusA family protein [Kiritimatiellia bacterium]|nr:sulfurtransferase TusA family protein [Kiritimatiellia bacterium]MDP6809494.1 sulfurtransferase TusA family protein [Kiritimatiellia bacterium]MDP7023829.1 sulfurtransferase TusA family protein [Kiritimatiellia bacterium]
MNEPFYKLPHDLAADIDAYEQDVEHFQNGEIPAGVFRAKRVPRGIYEQRQDGTYMVRVRVAGGTLTNEQSRQLADLSTEFGDGLLHVTTRQDVQLHGIAIKDTPAIMRRLMTVGLTSKGGGGNTVRNVTACPYAGICPHECFDVTGFAYAVTEYLIPLVGSYNLPRKYKIAFSGCAADCALAQVADLGFIAEVRDGVAGFRVLAGGGMGGSSRVGDELLPWTPATQVIRFAEAIRRLFDQHGDRTNKNRARLRFVFERLGLDAIRQQVSDLIETVTAEGVPEWQGDVALQAAPEPAPAGVPRPELFGEAWAVRQRQSGLVAVPLHLPLGFLPAGEFARIGDIAGTYSAEQGPRTMRSQNLVIRSVRTDDLPALVSELQTLETNVVDPVALERFVACAGASTCRLGLCLARGAARACAEALDAGDVTPQTLNAMEVYINGCPNACGQQPIGPLGLSGAARRSEGHLAPTYRVTLGGRCGRDGARLGNLVGEVPARALPAYVEAVMLDFQASRQDGEMFADYCDRVGMPHFEAITEGYTATPFYSEQPEFYRDFGADEAFSLAGRGAGECGSGVFEVIQEDLTAARKAAAPFDVLLPTVRALLITRGVDARDPDTVLREFERHFLDTGLVAETFRDLLSRARGFTQGWQQAFEGCESSVDQLLECVEQLYGTLDASLLFHPPDTADTASSQEDGTPPPASPGDEADGAATCELDLSGVTCPMNFVKAKLRLEGMDVGETLSIVLDDGAPIENVPASFKSEDQAIEAMEDLGDGHWKVVVRKEH